MSISVCLSAHDAVSIASETRRWMPALLMMTERLGSKFCASRARASPRRWTAHIAHMGQKARVARSCCPETRFLASRHEDACACREIALRQSEPDTDRAAGDKDLCMFLGCHDNLFK